MTDNEFEPEAFEEARPHVDDNPVQEGEESVNLIIASNGIPVRYYKGMTIQDALNQKKGNPEGDKFRLILDGSVVTLDTIVPQANSEIIFVGEWKLGSKKNA